MSSRNFRLWPSKVVVEGTDPDTNTYIGYSPVANAKKSEPVWLVERIDATGQSTFAADCLTGGMDGPEPAVAMTDPASLTYRSR